MSYLVAIKTALLAFPILSLFITLPYIIKQYRRYGSVNTYRTVIIYSFILYMITIYFLVILPLPKIGEVTSPLKEMVQLMPFGFIKDFLRETSLVISNSSTYLKALLEPCFYTVVLNVIMTIPFGIYLSYYFKCDLNTTIKWSFLLSLFFEVTQLTGLYFIYPYAYRVFDVDDLILNTLGGVIGFRLGEILTRFLPSRESIDEKSYEKGKKVSGFRRLLMSLFDIIFYFVIAFITNLFLKLDYLYFVVFLIYYGVVPFYIGSTLGGKILKVDFIYDNWAFIRGLLRSLFLYLYYFILPIEIVNVTIVAVQSLKVSEEISIFIYLEMFILLATFFLFNIFYILKNKYSFYDRFSKLNFKSTITFSQSSSS